MRKDTIEQNPLRAETGVQRYQVLAAHPTEKWLNKHRMHPLRLEKQNEELSAVEVSDNRYAELYNCAPVGYLTLTNEELVAETNPAALGLLGVDRKYLLHRHFADFVAAEDGDHWQLFFADALKHNKRKNIELTLKRYDGTEFPVRLDCLCVMDYDRKPVLYITLTDMTESKLSEAILQAVETHTLSLALAIGEMASWDWDIETGRVVFNERWAKMRGYRLGDIDSHVDTWQNGIYSADFSAYYDALTAHMENRTPFFQAEYRVRTVAGPLIWILNRGTVIKRDAEGNPLRMAGIEKDITASKNRQQRSY